MTTASFTLPDTFHPSPESVALSAQAASQERWQVWNTDFEMKEPIPRTTEEGMYIVRIGNINDYKIISKQFKQYIPGSKITTSDLKIDASGLEWIEDIYVAVKNNRPSEGLNILFSRIDKFLREKNFEKCESVIKATDLKRLDSTLMIGMLAITQPISSSSARKDLLDAIKNRIREKYPDRSEKLIASLR